MLYRSTQACVARGLFVVLAAIGLALGAAYGPAPLAAPGELADTPPRLQVVLLNGGGQPAINFYSHLLHVKQFSDVLRRAGLSPTDIAIFNADGADSTADFAVRDRQPAQRCAAGSKTPPSTSARVIPCCSTSPITGRRMPQTLRIIGLPSGAN